MPETTSHGYPVEVFFPIEVRRRLVAKLSEEEKQKYRANHTGINGPFEEKVLREAILPWAAEELGYDPENTELTVKGDFEETRSRNSDGTFSSEEESE